ncbi:uncharacterized protein LOC131877469 [Tigriopus californicus]|uniref:uncharacterized protein LOC131877469 n=1 Tax=Tigriopus californicus TaxID=6832 RepID=UPI0027DAA7A8|nr:uncharacterized protein LOC131877469 [Tigriopus californicus]
MDNESLSSGESGGGGPGGSELNESLLVRIGVPELHVDKCLQFRKDDLIWEVKQQCLAALPKELTESFNYGLFLPPSKGKAGKFLDEERRLREYPMEEPIGFLELKYKSRVYKTLQMDEKQVKNINSKASLKKFVDHVSNNNVEKINKMCAKGLDPNFHCQDSGETPLTLATGVKSKTARLIMSLINGGAIIDFRTKDGSTAMHSAVMKNNCEALRTLLDLGASPNYKDAKGLTPLYLTVTQSSDVDLMDTLLHDHAQIGLADLQGWQEVHQACRNGLLQHLERLLYYGAEKNAQNASGNTPLHVCAVNSQESCARSLLFRGANKEMLNYAGQTAFQTAVIANDAKLSELIQNHKSTDVIPFKDTPSYNPRRRRASSAAGVGGVGAASNLGGMSSSSSLSRSVSDAASMRSGSIQMESPAILSLRSNSSASGSVHSGRSSSASSLMKPPSPSPSDRSIPPFSSGSSVSEVSSGGSTTIGSTSRNGSLAGVHVLGLGAPIIEDEQLDSASTLAAPYTNDPNAAAPDVLSLSSSGIGTTSSSGSGNSHSSTGLILPGMHVVCLENNASNEPNRLHISQGDIIEVTASTDDGLLHGNLREKSGYFPATCVQEVRLRNAEGINKINRVMGRRETQQQQQQQQQPQPPQSSLQPHFSTASRAQVKIIPGEPRICVLHKGKKGFGFVLRGAKAASPLMEMIPSEKCPGLQYLDDVDPGGVADMAGVRKGDFVLEINGHDVSQASHERVVTLIRQSGDLVSLKVMTIPALYALGFSSGKVEFDKEHKSTRNCATLPRKLQGRPLVPHPPPPPKRDPSTTLSVGRAKARSMVADMAAIDALDKAIKGHEEQGQLQQQEEKKQQQKQPPLPPPPPHPEEARTSPDGSCNTPTQQGKTSKASELEHIFPSHPFEAKGKIYSSVAEMKRSKIGIKSRSADGEPPSFGSQPIHKDFHSSPDLKELSNVTPNSSFSNIIAAASQAMRNKSKDRSRSQERINVQEENAKNSLLNTQVPKDTGNENRRFFTLPSRGRKKETHSPKGDGASSSPGLKVEGPSFPPPEHPPPPPPVSQIVSVDTSKSPEYAQVSKIESPTNALPSPSKSESGSGDSIMSSFKPTDNAKLYASPENVQSVAYRAKQIESQAVQPPLPAKKRSPTRANSMPPRPNRPQVLRRSMVTDAPVSTGETVETYAVNGSTYTTYTTFRSPITPDEMPESYSTRVFQPEPLTPNAAIMEHTEPHIPEPDYDLSDTECNTIRKATTMERKKKKSVSFALDDEQAAVLQAAVKSARVESILKDGSRDRGGSSGANEKLDPYHCHHNVPFEGRSLPHRNVATAFVNEKYARPVDNIPEVKLNRQPLETFAHQPSVRREEKVRISITNDGPSKAVMVNRSSSHAGHLDRSLNQAPSIQKSQSFSAEKHNKVVSSKSHSSNQPTMTTSSGISANDIAKARSTLKPSRSFPQELTTEEGENSSSGVSSDQEVGGGGSDSSKFITYLPVDASLEPPNNGITKRSIHWDNVSESSDDVSEKSWVLRAEQDDIGQSIVSMKKMLHPKLAAIFDQPASSATLPSNMHLKSQVARSVSMGRGDGKAENKQMVSSMSQTPRSTALAQMGYSSKTLPSRGHHKATAGNPYHQNQHQHHIHGLPSGTEERSISESLALIQQHVHSLGEVNSLISTSSHPNQSDVGAVIPPVLAPPPGFSDSESFSDHESLNNAVTNRRFGFGKVSQATRNYSNQTLTEQLRTERSSGKPSGSKSHHRNSAFVSRTTDFDPFNSVMSKSADFEHGFTTTTTKKSSMRSKPLMGWTVQDVCSWLDNLFLAEYKPTFVQNQVDGLKLSSLTRGDLESLGIIKPAHIQAVEKSLKRILA